MIVVVVVVEGVDLLGCHSDGRDPPVTDWTGDGLKDMAQFQKSGAVALGNRCGRMQTVVAGTIVAVGNAVVVGVGMVPNILCDLVAVLVVVLVALLVVSSRQRYCTVHANVLVALIHELFDSDFVAVVVDRYYDFLVLEVAMACNLDHQAPGIFVDTVSCTLPSHSVFPDRRCRLSRRVRLRHYYWRARWCGDSIAIGPVHAGSIARVDPVLH